MSTFIEQLQISDPFVLTVTDRDEPHAGPGQVRIRARVAGLNPIDWKIAGNPDVAAAFGVTAPTGFGSDVAGEVDEIGAGVSGFSVGDRVFASARGRAAAEHVVLTVDADGIWHTPDGLADEVAGALPIAGNTAAAAIATAGVASGETVLIGGAAGGVGVIAVQLAVLSGATVIATASASNHDYLRALGAIPTTYGDGLAERVRKLAPQGLDAAIDLHGTETVVAAAALGVPGTRIATIAAGSQPPHGAIATGGGAATPEEFDRVVTLLAEGTIDLPIAATFPLAQIADAVALQQTGHVRGTVLVTI